MGKAIARSEWDAEADRVFAEIEGWRVEHATASLDEIEVAIEARLAELRQRLVRDTIQTSASADMGEGAERTTCPRCGERLQKRGRARRTVQTGEGAEVTIERAYGWCPRCQVRVFPPGPGIGAASE